MSRCPQCQHNNPDDAKFCLECGGRLALSCSACGTELPAGAKFCKEVGQAVGADGPPTAARVGAPPESYTPKHLAEKVLTATAALEGGRKQVTVLFADLKVSEQLHGADRDPEEARKIIEPVLTLMMNAVHHHGDARRPRFPKTPARFWDPVLDQRSSLKDGTTATSLRTRAGSSYHGAGAAACWGARWRETRWLTRSDSGL